MGFVPDEGGEPLQPVAIRGNQRQSEAIRCNPLQPVAIHHTPWPP